jgi:hypothetical protein
MSYTITDTFSGSGPTSACGATAIVNINLAVALDNGSTNNAGSGVVTQAKVIHSISKDVLYEN